MHPARSLGAVVFVASAVLSCTSTTEQSTLPPFVVGMPSDTAPTYDDGEQKIFQVSRELRLPFRRPHEGEAPRGSAPPYGSPPFHVASASKISVRFTLSNLDDAPHTVELLVDPWNELVRYVPGMGHVHDNEVRPNVSGIDRFFALPPKGRIDGILTPDDMVELAVDLTTAMRIADAPPPNDGAFAGPVLYNRAFNVQNRSSEPDPVLAPFMPLGPVAAVIGFDLGLRTREPAKVAVEAIVDIQDIDGERVLREGDDGRRIGRPAATLTPPATPAR